MSWSISGIEHLRMEFVMIAREPAVRKSEACRQFGISRKTGYKRNNGDANRFPLTAGQSGGMPPHSKPSTRERPFDALRLLRVTRGVILPFAL